MMNKTRIPKLHNKAIRPKQIGVTRVERLLPDEKREAVFLSRLGYKVHEALADLVDNSIDAHANKILIRFVRTTDKIARVLIVDNGSGMDDDTLTEAMRFGSKNAKDDNELGKYGIGLKTASLSQAKSVTVLSRQGKAYTGRRWTADNIGKGWLCEVLKEADVAAYLTQDFAPVQLNRSGTIVIWEDLEHLRSVASLIDNTLQTTIGSVSTELGLRFHRFISDDRIQIVMDTQIAGLQPTGICIEVAPLDPFNYPQSGSEDYPRTFAVELAPHSSIHLECHIWPPKSKASEYRLGRGKVAARQGFYFYRNDRLIQAGGWNGYLNDDSEPHLSLARVKVDLPARFDSIFKLNLAKSSFEPPPDFVPRVSAARNRGHAFKEFISDAQRAYRKQKKKDSAQFPFIPGRGFPADSKSAARRILHERGTGKPKTIHFSWRELEPHVFFSLDRDKAAISLNKLYRRKVLQSGKASAVDAPLVKLLLMFLLQKELLRKNDTEKYLAWVDGLNNVLIATLKKMA